MAVRSRLAGVDTARGVAVLGMAAVHVLPQRADDGSTSLAYLVASGRASAAFAVLAGVGVALATRRGDRTRSRLRLALRAVLIGAVGLVLGDLDSGVAVILTYYAVFFLLLLPFLGWPPRRLLLTAGAVAVVAPVLGQLLRPVLSGAGGANPTWSSLEDPGPLAVDLLLSGVYPAVPWAAYLLTGLAVGQLALDRTGTAVRLVLAGAALAAAAAATSAVLLGPLGGHEALADLPGNGEPADVEELLADGLYGTVPTDSPWWLASDARHSSTPLDLVGTGGSALLLLGACLLLARAAGPLLAPLAAVGSMPLTLYSLHVWLLSVVDHADPERFYALQVVAALVAATLWRRWLGRGPLEAALAVAGRAVRPPRQGRLPT